MDFPDFVELFNDYKYPDRSSIYVTMKDLCEVLKVLSDRNMFFECVHVSLFKKNHNLFFDKVWKSFLKHHKKFFDLYQIGMTLEKWRRNKTIEEIIENRKTHDFRKTLFSGDNVSIKFCHNCHNFQIKNRYSGANNVCRYCKGRPLNVSKDRQFFANLSLLKGPSKDIIPRPYKPKPRSYRRGLPLFRNKILSQKGYQLINKWAEIHGMSRQNADIIISQGRVPVLYVGGHQFVKIKEPLPDKKFRASEVCLAIKNMIWYKSCEEPTIHLYYDPIQLQKVVERII